MFPSATDLSFHQVFKYAPTPLVVMAADSKFTITAMNDAYLRVTMTQEKDILGKGMFEAFPSNPDTPDATGVTQLLASLEAVIAKGTPQTMPIVKYDIRQPDGTFLERYWSAVHTPIFDDQGEVAYILQYTEDVTDVLRLQQRDMENTLENRRLQVRTNQMEAEVVRRVEELEDAYKRLEESEHKFRILADDAVVKQNRYSAAVQASRQLLYDWDPKTNALWYEGDTEELLGYTLEEMKGGLQRWIELVHPDDREVFNAEIARVLESGEPADVEFRIVRKDGQIIYCEDRGHFFKDATGNLLRMVGFVRDVTARRKAERDLRDNQQRLSIAQKSGHVGVFDWTLLNNRIVWTPELEELYGLAAGEFEGGLDDWAKRVVPQDAQRIISEIEDCIKEQRCEYSYEFRVVLPDGTQRWLAAHASFQYDSEGKPLRMIGVNVDIHERKKAEDALRLSEQRMQLAIAIAQMGTFDICLETDAVIVNDIGRAIYGWPADLDITFAQVQEHFYPDDREHVVGEVQRALDPNGSREFEVEQRIIRTDGTVRWIRVRGRGVFENSVAVATRIVGTYLDITQAKQVEERLLESEEKFRTLADNMSQLAWMMDGNGEVLWYNKRFLDYISATPEQLKHEGWYAYLASQDKDRVLETYAGSIAAGTPWDDTFLLRGGDGRYRWFLSRAMPVKNDGGAVTRWFVTNTDVTEQREAELAIRDREERLAELNLALEQARDEAVAASAAKSTFLATMSHELRTPLNAVIGYAELLKDAAEHGNLSGPALVADLERISLSGEHLLTLISDILDFSKIEAGRMELARETVDLQQLLDDAAVSITPQNAAKGNHLTVCGPGTGTLITGDYTRLKQILINLLGNAAKFTTGGQVILEGELRQSKMATTQSDSNATAAAPKDMLIFRVQDTGIGIAPEHVPLLFESFRQLDVSNTRQHGGTGLGLAITKRLVELMGGQISLVSETGKGTTFTVELPQS